MVSLFKRFEEGTKAILILKAIMKMFLVKKTHVMYQFKPLNSKIEFVDIFLQKTFSFF